MSRPSDAKFSLGLAHDGPRLRASTRSPSPQVSSKPQFSPSSSHGIHKISRRVIRRLSNLQQPTQPDVLDDTHDNMKRLSRKSSNDSSPWEKQKHSPKLNHSDWEIPRKTLHSSIGFFTLYLYLSNGSARPVILVLWLALAVIVPADVLRLSSSRFERVYERCLGFLMRETEKRSINGVIWYILGVNFALSVYPLDIAVVSILILSWADTAASTVGRLLGAYTPPLPRHVPLLHLPLAPRKSLAGFLAASVTGAAIAIGFWGQAAPAIAQRGEISWNWESGVSKGFVDRSNWVREGMTMLGVATGVRTGGWAGLGVVGVVAGLVTGVAEALDIGALDDNLTLPIITGGCLLGLFKVLRLFSS